MEALVSATSGGIAGALGSLAVYPLDFLLIRKLHERYLPHGTPLLLPPWSTAGGQRGGEGQAEEDPIERGQEDQPTDHGFAGIYAGWGFKMTESFCRQFVYFYIYQSFKQRYVRQFGPLKSSSTLVLATAAAVVNQCLTGPLDLVSTNLHTTSLSPKDVVKSIYRCEGILGFYRGFGASLVLCFNPAITNATFDSLKDFVIQAARGRLWAGLGEDDDTYVDLQAFPSFLLGAISKAVATILTYPHIRSKVIVQAQAIRKAQLLQMREQHEGSHASASSTPFFHPLTFMSLGLLSFLRCGEFPHRAARSSDEGLQDGAPAGNAQEVKRTVRRGVPGTESSPALRRITENISRNRIGNTSSRNVKNDSSRRKLETKEFVPKYNKSDSFRPPFYVKEKDIKKNEKVILRHNNDEVRSLSVPTELFLYDSCASLPRRIAQMDMLRAASFCTSEPDDGASRVSNDWKPMLQRSYCDILDEHEAGVLEILVKTVMQDGVFGLYKGLGLQLLKTVLAAAILYMVKEKLHRATHRVFRLLGVLLNVLFFWRTKRKYFPGKGWRYV